MWGSNARNAHPIFFHHVLKAVNNGAKLYVVDPRRSETAQFADRWLGLHVGTDIALSNTIAREIIHAGLAHERLHRPRHHRLRGLRGVGRGLDARTRRAGHRRAGRGDPRARPHLRHRQGRPAVLDARHHRAPQRRRQRARALQPGAAHRAGRPLRRRAQPAARPEQRAGRRRHGRPARTSCPASRTSIDEVARKKFETLWGTTIPAEHGWHLTQMFEAMEHGDLRSLFVIGENPAQSEADSAHAVHVLESLDHLVVLDIYLTKTAQLADVVLPGSASWCEADGTVTNSERRVQRVRKATRSARRRPRRHPDPARRGGAARPPLALRQHTRTCGTSCAACRRCTPACRGSGSRSWAASSGRATPRTGSNRRTCTGGCGPTTPTTAAARRRSAS